MDITELARKEKDRDEYVEGIRREGGAFLSRFRHERGWSQKELSNRLGFKSQTTVSKVERGKLTMTKKMIMKLAELMKEQ